MGVDSINHVMPYVKNPELKKVLNACKDKHAVLGDETHKTLNNMNMDTKNPHPVAKAMSDVSTRMKITVNRTDNEIASVYSIHSIPTLILFKNGRILWRASGLRQASDIETKIREFL
jgi:thioredoxin-related protein